MIKSMIIAFVFAFVGAASASIGFIFVLALLFNWMWNAVPAVVFHLPSIGYWQAIGLLLLGTIVRCAVTGMGIKLKLRDPKL